MDTIDTAQEYIETIEQVAIDNARKDVNTENPSGLCWYCEEKIGTHRRWCDADCCKDWEAEQ